MSQERMEVYAYKCWDCDRVIFAFERDLPKICPFCECKDMMRLKDRATVAVTPAEESRA